MGHKHIYECVDHSLREVRQEPHKLFGGLIVLFSGGWKQILLVMQRGSRAQVVHATLKQSYIWNHVQNLQLSVTMRVQASGGDNTAFASCFGQLGNGKFPINQDIGEYKIFIPPLHLIDSTRLKDLSEVIIRSTDEKYGEGLWMSSRAIITPTNKVAEEVNTVVMLKLLQGDSESYGSCEILHETINGTDQ
ncbi:ATP-dependent DNA helicase [Octopus vulgaris]|uniref:ATP-dependent DNA helicase n=1 Tax=Octopus vulgaris TaxID=6645 RepID=A0AA36EVL5_OCTVU|nr:ATP-dependent DNA helicase [Octopus vulgaris]